MKKVFFVKAVRYPTVAKDRARLRITITALHTHEHLERFAKMLAVLLRGNDSEKLR